ncbi:MAG: hypothetical protein A3C80_03995 [Candidatus Ryanbacteria bacterium RIFCSPHIGHO2_02_FULL_45_43]|uniref:Band 7 domain-containing protein n=1 Tax=Candidatus Ryanbacteria bacterium RIFCSPHIGHO2_01_45_13 TaxID=1802112 RepID=A0A1G2FWU7_9BACT|nr:MAG: hypothetical protein A2718_00025 [Candidatus Ryanbacteria bacterium RIFCSPHIGHO2_01_FULL_44_130]OGZ42554.1 MAG: hypothetical protein A2W41_01635 [Candidatus Ryanbacteria bacterium RIFCSPHIGHO2_01_45_13]OGZ48197.1 MAG: hypothetical protein A3C80_03995 [Candidatus Ryanbacteria bacterium RIFCSPHIGHO2_02_FULL_45_43]OGZ49974.1 MAG: hypothetical protein A3E55_01655 [Candidatus Ryanbacteria bacterium RIFCSPHIGHO2_12_FULL_44_20]OGZ51432.1 MAG: hypothetical protein A3A17_01605 [Candidatus Ryanba
METFWRLLVAVSIGTALVIAVVLLLYYRGAIGAAWGWITGCLVGLKRRWEKCPIFPQPKKAVRLRGETKEKLEKLNLEPVPLPRKPWRILHYSFLAAFAVAVVLAYFVFESWEGTLSAWAVLGVVGGSSITIVREQRVAVVELLWRYWNTWPAGIYVRIPFIMPIRRIVFTGDLILNRILDGATEDEDNAVHSLVDLTNDSVRLKIRITIRVSDDTRNGNVYRAIYLIRGEEKDYVHAVWSVVETSVRATFGKKSLTQAIQETKTIQEALRKTFSPSFLRWGVDFRLLLIEDVELLEPTVQLRRQRLQAEVDRDSSVLRAEGDRDSAILRAEGERDASALEGIGEGLRIKYGAERSGLTEREMFGGTLAREQFAAMREATLFVTGGEGMSIPTFVAQAATVVDAVQKKKEDKKQGEKGKEDR